jgi:hypothetical protein
MRTAETKALYTIMEGFMMRRRGPSMGSRREIIASEKERMDNYND